MVKTIIPWALLAAVAIFFAYYLGNGNNREEIERVKTERTEMKMQRDSIQAVVALKDSLQKILDTKISILEQDAESLRDHIGLLEELRKEEQINVRSLSSVNALERKFLETFPEIQKDKLKIFDQYDTEYDVSIDYLGIPVWFSETFIIDHQNAANYKEQNVKLRSLDSLNAYVSSLKDTLFYLEKEKSLAYKTGYDSAYSKYLNVSRLYMKELSKPRFDLPHWGAVVAGGLAGFFIAK